VKSRVISNAEARRIVLAAQGFDGSPRPTKPGWAQMAKTIGRLNLLQIDSVNVVVRSHYLPLFSRLGNYDRALLDARSLGTGKRHMFECWGHEASLVPMDLHPLMRWRMARARSGDGVYPQMDRFTKEEPEFLRSTLAYVEKNGPTRVRDVPEGGKGLGGWWGWSKGKLALETLFDHGLVTTAAREGFERIYDIPARVVPPDVLSRETPRERHAIAQLMDLSGRALGIGTEIDLRDYFRLPVDCAKQAIADNVAAGVLEAVAVQGWKQPAYLHRDAKRPRWAGGTALLTPFDPLVWNRPRTERLFDFHYRIELYTPAHKRKFGYYVLPFLMEDKLVGRVCLKADRDANKLLVNAAHVEEGADPVSVASALSKELSTMSEWLGLAGVSVARKGSLAGPLRKAT
jgi:uncharacterized protein